MMMMMMMIDDATARGIGIESIGQTSNLITTRLIIS